jgi:hypothetical protein
MPSKNTTSSNYIQDDNGDIIGYTAKEVFDHLLDQYVQPEDVADQITELHKILEQSYDPNSNSVLSILNVPSVIEILAHD